MQTSIHRIISTLFILAFLAAGAVFFTQPTSATPAENLCDLTVNDRAKVLTTTQFSNVTSAAKNLEASAPNSAVRVVTVSKTSNNLAELAHQECGSSWYSNPSTLKSNMIVLMVKPPTQGQQDGKSHVAAGSMYPEINAQRQRLLDTMKPDFQRGDYASGLTTGLRSMQPLVQSNSQPSSDTQNPSQGTANPTSNLSTLWIIVGIILVLGVLVMLAVLIIYMGRIKKGEKERRRVAQQDAKFIRTRSVNALRELTDKLNDPSLQARLELASQASTVNAQILQETYQALSTNLANLSIDLRNITSSASNPDEDRTLQEYQRICSYFAPIVREADDLQQRVTHFEHQLDEVERDPRVQLGTSSSQPRGFDYSQSRWPTNY